MTLQERFERADEAGSKYEQLSQMFEAAVIDEDAQSDLLVGEPEDFPYGLVTNRGVKGDLCESFLTLSRAERERVL